MAKIINNQLVLSYDEIYGLRRSMLNPPKNLLREAFLKSLDGMDIEETENGFVVKNIDININFDEV